MSAETQDHAHVLAFPPLIFALHAVAGGLAHWLCPIPLLPTLPARLLGAGLALAAGAQAFWASRIMHRAGTNVNPDKPTIAIVAAGPYRYTRNPMYFSLCLLLLAIGLLLDGVLPVLFVVPLALTLHFGVVRREERYLAAKFGETYLAYQRRVRRWI
ncbi:MAG: isoprenylcysteine carboxylmethyltransferase family protein [bacterium]|nr:isoprenylcysteine carboxylmethyltransferase family protein [bacterium]MDI1335611.1 isoprenylcysteine carboxylmethyltransferase family protein [Lacunisphaera sp.]